MKGVRPFVRLNKLEEGMIIDQAVTDRLDRVLVHRGSTLDKFVIQSLEKLGIPGVYIRGDDYVDETKAKDPNEEIEAKITPLVRHTIEKAREDDPVKVQLSETVRKRVSTGMQYLYNNTESENFTHTSNNITNDLMKALDENDALAVDISTLRASDEYTFRHSVDVATISMVIGKNLGLRQAELHDIGIAGLLHDMGKSKIPPEILNKPAKLTDEEFEVMKQHPVLGYRILQEKKDFNSAISMAVLQHHEKMNGKGYPMGVTADKITRYARILSVADVYDALVTNRPYKKSYSQRTAVDILMSMTDDLDVEVMRVFLQCVILYSVDSIVTLSNGEIAKVVKNNPESALRPTVVGIETGNIYDLANDVKCTSIVIE